MPFTHVFDLELYYEECGSSSAPTLLLIHGSGQTGRSAWEAVLEPLAARFHIILPDCRGHGQTLDPRDEYTFTTLAKDLAELLRVLNLAPAFIAGHSNGGNVALVMSVEYPEAARRAVLMAANAFVSPDLLRYGDGKWGERIAARDPEWARELTQLHDVNRYAGYWKDLMRRTALEIARAPDYSADDLARVRVPTLIIQGEEDAVNAPGHHAEFMHAHLPNSQLWLAPNTGHSVHLEHPEEWVERVSEFLLTSPSPPC